MTTTKLTIAVLGAGNIGGTLGRKWVAAGHRVAFGVSDPGGSRAQALRAEAGDKVTAGSLADGLLISSSYIPPENVPPVQQIIDDAARAAGCDPLAIRRGYNLMGTIQRPGDRSMTARRPGVIIGPPQLWIDELLRYYHDLRFDTFFFWPLMGNEEAQARLFVEEAVAGVREKLNLN